MTDNLRDDDIAEIRELIERLERNLAERESARSVARAEEGPAQDSELAIEISQRRRYIDELRADLDELINAPFAERAFEDEDTTEAAAPQGLAIVIGHSSEGSDKGALGLAPPFPAQVRAGRAEFYWNEDLAKRIEQKAASRGIRVQSFRRMQNGGPGIREAYRLIGRWRPQATVELHFNSASASARGTETLFGRPGSRPWAKALQDRMVPLYGRTGRLDRGLKDANVDGRGVLSLTNAVQPSAIIEPFFGSNPEDASLGIERKDRLAEALVNAFAAFAGLPLSDPMISMRETPQRVRVSRARKVKARREDTVSGAKRKRAAAKRVNRLGKRKSAATPAPQSKSAGRAAKKPKSKARRRGRT